MSAGLWRCRFFLSDLDVGTCTFYENMPIETFNISFGNKQQYGTKITCTEISGGGGGYDD